MTQMCKDVGGLPLRLKKEGCDDGGGGATPLYHQKKGDTCIPNIFSLCKFTIQMCDV